MLVVCLFGPGGRLALAADGPLVLQRGVNLQWPSGAPVTQSVVAFDEIKALGFDFVRLSVVAAPLLSAEGDSRREIVARLDEAIGHARESGLNVVLALRYARQAEPEAIPDSLVDLLDRVDTTATALELTNDIDSGSCDVTAVRAWEAFAAGMVRESRKVAPDLTLIVSGACGGDAKGLVRLDPAALDDDRLVFSFHFHEPIGFTSQGMGPAKDVKGAPWPADAVAKPLALVLSKLLISLDEPMAPADREMRTASVRRHLDGYLAGGWEESRLKARFGEVRAWAERYGVPPARLLLAAFGLMPADQTRCGALDGDRFRWLEAVRREAEALGAAWAYWDYSGSPTIPDMRPDPVALVALGLIPGGDDHACDASPAMCAAMARETVGSHHASP